MMMMISVYFDPYIWALPIIYMGATTLKRLSRPPTMGFPKPTAVLGQATCRALKNASKTAAVEMLRDVERSCRSSRSRLPWYLNLGT